MTEQSMVWEIPWREGLVYPYRGQTIHAVLEDGRRFWATRVADPGGWSLRQEFCTVEDAARYIDGRLTPETEAR